jgi:hypothetical protein
MHNKVFKSSGVINKLNIFVFLLPVVTVDKYDFKSPPALNTNVGSNAQMKRRLLIIGALATVYMFSYLIFRNTNVETWDKDVKQYVIFSKGQTWIYYLFRPLNYIDSKVTTMNFHLGPHE